MSIDDVKHELTKRIEAFFGSYKDNNDIYYIIINVLKFVNSLLDDQNTQTSRYVYLYGSGGIGKTHFVQTLSEWIDELIPGSVLFKDIIINSAEELEGSDKKPGTFVNVVHDQLTQNKRGAVIIIDEAAWLNDPSMIPSAKRVFNGDRSKIVTTCFGTNLDGSSLSLEAPPMLIFVAGNDMIKDPALESRFDLVNYPSPSAESLTGYAYNIAEKSIVLKQANCPIDKNAILKWIQSLDIKYHNFRYIASNVEAFLLKNRKK